MWTSPAVKTLAVRAAPLPASQHFVFCVYNESLASTMTQFRFHLCSNSSWFKINMTFHFADCTCIVNICDTIHP